MNSLARDSGSAFSCTSSRQKLGFMRPYREREPSAFANNLRISFVPRRNRVLEFHLEGPSYGGFAGGSPGVPVAPLGLAIVEKRYTLDLLVSQSAVRTLNLNPFTDKHRHATSAST